MLKFSNINGPEGPFYAFGLSQGNLNRLRQGKPILINLADIKGKGHVLIFYGETEQDMLKELKDSGIVIHD